MSYFFRVKRSLTVTPVAESVGHFVVSRVALSVAWPAKEDVVSVVIPLSKYLLAASIIPTNNSIVSTFAVRKAFFQTHHDNL